MTDEHLPTVEPVRSPWREQLIEALLHVQRDLLLVGPYIKDDVIAMLRDTLEARLAPQPLSVRVITRALPDDFLSGASDIAALQHLLAWPTGLAGTSVEIRIINNLHAKVWVFDTNLAIVGSGNTTFSGLESNLEYGMAISEPQSVGLILRDWQEWWEQASPVNESDLEQMRLWLEAIESDTDIRKAAKLAQEKRQTAERRIGTAPRIGARLALPRSARQGDYAISERPDFYGTALIPDSPHTPDGSEMQDAVSHMLPAIVHVPASHLWHALCWTTSSIGKEPQPYAANGAFLKMTAKPIRSASQERTALQCIWADGQRFSQATIQGHAHAIQPSWTITLGSSAVQQLAAFIQHMRGQGTINNQLPSESDLFIWWLPSPSRLCISQDGEGSVPIAIPCIPAAMAGNAPILRPPLSQITIDQESLLTGLMTLKHQWERLHPDTPAPASIELSFGSPGAVPTIQLSTGSIESPLVLSVPAIDCLISGPQIRLRLDLASFQHVVSNAPGRVRRWYIRVDRDAEAMQFVPEFDSEMAWAGSLTWVHELRDVAGG